MCGADPDLAFHFGPYLASLFDAELVSQHDGNPDPQHRKKIEWERAKVTYHTGREKILNTDEFWRLEFK
jgi:hypothetical protein